MKKKYILPALALMVFLFPAFDSASVHSEDKATEYTGYLYAYFSGDESRLDDQQIYFAISKDGLTWDDLNENNPVLTSVLGDQGVRDPFIIRSPEGDRFYLIATDLDIRADTYNGNWGLMATQGSNAIMVWESEDLVTWSEQRMVDVSSPVLAGNTWAPEAIYDEKEGKYMVFWSSRVATDNYAKHRIYAAYTADFITFSDPFVYVDTPNGTIDASIHKIGDTYYRLIKDDQVLSVSLSYSNQLNDENSSYASGNSFEKIQNDELESYSGGYEGPTLFQFNGEEKWCVLVDEYVGSRRGYIPFVSTDLSAVNSLSLLNDGEYLMPTGAKHGTVIPITEAEYNALYEKWGVKPPEEVMSDSPVLHYDFEEELSNSRAMDKSGHAHHAHVFGNAEYVTDTEKGKVLHLDGTSETYLAFPQGFFDGRSQMTISMDVKPVTTDFYHFTFAVGLNSTKYMFLRTRDNEIRNAITTQSYSKESEVLKTGSSFLNHWINIKLVMDHHNMKLYLDNVLVDSNAFVHSIGDLGTNLLAYLGKSFYADPYFEGYFDNVRVYNKAFATEEIQSGLSTAFRPLASEKDWFNLNYRDGQLTINFDTNLDQTKYVDIINSQGQLLHHKSFDPYVQNVAWNSPFKREGIYFVRVSTMKGKSTKKIRIQ